jgi:hypothetical protein
VNKMYDAQRLHDFAIKYCVTRPERPEQLAVQPRVQYIDTNDCEAAQKQLILARQAAGKDPAQSWKAHLHRKKASKEEYDNHFERAT